MTSETNERYIGGQVRSRANVILTRRDDLRVVETREQTGLDMHVYVDREDKPMRLVFGVLLRGVPSPTTADEANKILVPTMGFFQGLRKFTYHIYLFSSRSGKNRRSSPGSPSPWSTGTARSSSITRRRIASS